MKVAGSERGLSRSHIETLLKLVEKEINASHKDWYENKRGMFRTGVLAARGDLYALASFLTYELCKEERKEVKNG